MSKRAYLYWCVGMLLLSVLALGLTSWASTATRQLPSIRLIDDFELGLNSEWQIERFDGETEYSVEQHNGNSVLQARSQGTASALLHETTYSLQDYPYLSWRWKIEDTLPQGDARTKQGDDYAARIYVVFPHWFFPLTRSINYIWANQLPRGSHLPSTYTANSVMVAVESGRDNRGQWRLERRNVLEDFRRLFGEEPPAVGAIAIMTDSDNTQGSALAWYDDIRIEQSSQRQGDKP